ncbi:MFS transporter [Agrobacterium rubi]|uniref:MFS transporter n=1 Tax=Agrobacterium rubi TaxID=28099 RepID=A0AAE7UT16_9HYPH|nr:MFS transporter [Agrobacterium rubi]MCL6652662.1 MFS transporter [Agrobacterium rubi]NTE87468.1 MFS transporter [Agrobacterium rubi]NTF03322.1 MFS transporter [Agrobacterium rubi]NTF09760.1 MFS transporter [Agrobacterium rubi]NTF22063.1 MFS transporter [Agrobacterium rubi]
MRSALSTVIRNPSIRVGALAILFFGFSNAATAPYQAVIGIRELGLSDGTYSLLMLVAAVINVSASVLMGIVADRLGEYRKPMLCIALFGISGYFLVYFAANAPAFIAAKLLLLPIFGAMNSLIFAHVRADAKGLSPKEMISVNSIMRATISLSWVLVPGIVGIFLAASNNMLSAFLLSGIFATVCFLLVAVYLPKTATPVVRNGEARFGLVASLGEICAPRVLLRVISIALICSMLHLNDFVRALIITGQARGTVTDIGIVVGIVAGLEIVFIVMWGIVERRSTQRMTLATGAVIYAVYLVLQGFATQPWHIYAQTLISGLGAAAIISIPITYLQELIADRPGLGSSLIAVNIFLSAGIGSLVFAIGTYVSDYAGASILGAVFGLAGIVMLFVLDGTRRVR